MSHENFHPTLNVYIVDQGRIIKDISHIHAFVGYHPVVFAMKMEIGKMPSNLEIIFTDAKFNEGARIAKKGLLARLAIKKICNLSVGNDFLFFYEAVSGSHYFIPKFRQYIISFHNRLFQKKDGNIFLKGNLYKQVQIAYSLPRKISLITIASNNLFNLFPTDLHGPVDEDFYVISLRHNGLACAQVENLKNILLSDMNANVYREVYKLGKNHMQPLKEKHTFHFSSELSPLFHLPIPYQAVKSYELEWQSSFKAGIHNIMLFRIRNVVHFNTTFPTLAHVHNVYATWRHKNQLPGNYLLR
jgi:hypothetical protein